jgi:hypothetical protein
MEQVTPQDPDAEAFSYPIDPEWTKFLEARQMKAAETTTPNEVQENDKYTSKEFARLIALSFHFSQGDTSLQTEIFDFLAIKYGDKFSKDLVDEAEDEVMYMAYKRISNPNLHLALRGEGSFKYAKENVQPMMNYLKEAIESSHPLKPVSTLSKIIARDHLFLCQRSGRDRDHEEKAGPGGMENSQIVQYGFTKSPTSSEEYDNFFTTISDTSVLQEYFDTRELDPKDPESGATLSVTGMPLLEEVLFVHFGANPEDIEKIDPEVKKVLLKNIKPRDVENIGLER